MTSRILAGPGLAALAFAGSACDPVTYVEIAQGVDILPNARTALAEDGTVAAAGPDYIIVGDGSAAADSVDLTPYAMAIGNFGSPIAVRSSGELVMATSRFDAACGPSGRGAYQITTLGGPLTTYHESCVADPVGAVRPFVDVSPNGTVAFSSIVNGQGALHRGPIAGPVEVLRSGTGTFFNTGGIGVNDAGRVSAQMEYLDGFAGGLMRTIFVLDTPEQTKFEADTAIEKMSIGEQPSQSINGSGTVAFVLRNTVSFPLGGMMYTYEPGVYTATPTLFNTPKDITLLVGHGGAYCGFGAVDINDAGSVVFEAQLDAEPHCGGTFYDGLFTGADPAADALVQWGDEGLGGHQFYDRIHMGRINNAGQVSFLTTYSEPLVLPIKVWRADPS